MSEIFQNLAPADEKLFFQNNNPNDVRLGEIVSKANYDKASIVIIGCPQDEGTRRCGGRLGTAQAPDAIRGEFYQLTPFGINTKIIDLGNINVKKSLEEIHDNLSDVLTKVLKDGKKAIVLGGGTDIAYPAGRSIAKVYGAGNWLGVNVNAHFDIAENEQGNSETPYRILLEEKLIRPDYLYEIAYQPHFASPIYFRYLQNLGVNLVSLDQIRSRESSDLELRELMRQKFIHHSESLNGFFSFCLEAVRSSDAPGTCSPSPIGLRSGEFLNLVQFAAKLVNTRVVEFTGVNPKFDVDNRTVKLVAIAMHKFCSQQK